MSLPTVNTWLWLWWHCLFKGMFALNVNKTCAPIPVIHTPPVSSFFCIYMLQCGNEVVNGESESSRVFYRFRSDSYFWLSRAMLVRKEYAVSKSWMPLAPCSRQLALGFSWYHGLSLLVYSVYSIEQFLLQARLKFSNFAIEGIRCTGWWSRRNHLNIQLIFFINHLLCTALVAITGGG